MTQKLLNLCYVITRSDVMGGASVHLLDLALGMQKAGHQVTILVGGYGIVNEKAKALGLLCHSVPSLVRPIHPFQDLKTLFVLRRWFKQIQPDLIHLHSSKAGLVGRLSAIGLGIPVVFTAHGWSFTEGVSANSVRIYRSLEKWIAPLTDKIVTVSDYDRQRALQLGVSNPKQMQTIHNGMPDISAVRHRTPGSVLTLIMVARFEQPKDHLLLLQAVSQLTGQWQLKFVGDGPLMDKAQQTAVQLGLTDKVKFLGARNDVADLLAQSDIFVLLSRWEGLPLTILEAMRAGLPVVASKVGGVPEAVDHHRTGICVDNDQLSTITAALQLLIDHPELVIQFGAAGQLRFMQNFTFDLMQQRTLALYQSLTGGR